METDEDTELFEEEDTCPSCWEPLDICLCNEESDEDDDELLELIFGDDISELIDQES